MYYRAPGQDTLHARQGRRTDRNEDARPLPPHMVPDGEAYYPGSPVWIHHRKGNCSAPRRRGRVVHSEQPDHYREDLGSVRHRPQHLLRPKSASFVTRKGLQSGYRVTAEKPLVLHGMRSYMAAPQVQMRKEEFSLRYATYKKEELQNRLGNLSRSNTGVNVRHTETQAQCLLEQISEYTDMQMRSRRRLADLRRVTSTAHLELQNE